ncbi:MAG: hypothetical protein B7X11_00555 [Acidobacteria bacterium 37-65-4]|nr:MAG: hypothetical protein B7X11_00555 [Acidobacteria bacterium 37-65-4]
MRSAPSPSTRVRLVGVERIGVPVRPETLNHYRVLRTLGSGGMGEVYLAEDTKLHRNVAIKVLLEDAAEDHDRRERFAREARAVAALSHPNIVTIHSVEEDAGRLFLTMEYVDGRPLTEVIPSNGLPLDKLLAIAIPLADAVAAAHERGIVHRDLKPANVMIAADGRVKVLDFGLARLRADPAGQAATMTHISGEGRILGTAAYMSPEQAEGRPVDARSDLFSLGILLFEMATGERPFTGDTNMSVISAILRDAPPSISAIRPDVPRELGRIIKRALQKDPEQRYQTAKDLRNDLRLLKAELDSGELAAPAPVAVRPRRRPAGLWWAAGAATLVLVVLAGAVGHLPWRPASPMPRLFERFDVRKLTTDGDVGTCAISPDGTYVAYSVFDKDGQTLRMRQPATGAETVIVPRRSVVYVGLTFSPDSQYLYYVTASESPGALYAYFISPVRGRLFRVPSLGGSPTELTDDVYGMVGLSPDGKRVAFYRVDARDQVALVRSNVDGSEAKVLATRELPQRFVATGPAWSPDGRTIAAPFDSDQGASISTLSADDGKETAPPIHDLWGMIQQVAWAPDGSGLFLAAAHQSSTWGFQIWFASYPDGTPRRVTNDANNYFGVSVSRDARSLVVLDSEWPTNLWVGLPGRPGAISQVGSPGDGFFGVAWSPDGRLLFGTRDFDIGVCDADGDNRHILTVDQHNNRFPATTRDGRHIFFRSWREFGTSPMWRMNRDGGDVRAVTRGPGGDRLTVSPDGKWVFYVSPGVGGRARIWKVSSDGGTPEPVTDRVSMVAVSPDGRLLAGPRKTPGAPASVSVLSFDGGSEIASFDAPPGVTEIGTVRWTSDGQSLLYSGTVNGVSNIWIQHLRGGRSTRTTDFTDEYIQDFDSAPDGRLAIARLHISQNILQLSVVK